MCLSPFDIVTILLDPTIHNFKFGHPQKNKNSTTLNLVKTFESRVIDTDSKIPPTKAKIVAKKGTNFGEQKKRTAEAHPRAGLGFWATSLAVSTVVVGTLIYHL